MCNNLNKAISTPLTIGIILILSVLLSLFTFQQLKDIEKESFTGEEINFQEGGTGEISSWKTYHSQEYGFEIKYPPEWEVDGPNCVFFNGNMFKICVDIEPIFDACLLENCSVSSTVKIDGLDAEKELNAIWGVFSYDKEGYLNVVSDGELICNQREGCIPCQKQKEMPKEECEKIAFLPVIISKFNHKGNSFNISLVCEEKWRGPEGMKECNNFYDKIISTFKFVEK